MWKRYISTATIEETLAFLSSYGNKARIVAGATDLMLEIERGARKNIEAVIDISRIIGNDKVILDENNIIHLGPLVTHNICVCSKIIQELAYPLAQACWEVGSPQIRNRGRLQVISWPLPPLQMTQLHH